MTPEQAAEMSAVLYQYSTLSQRQKSLETQIAAITALGDIGRITVTFIDQRTSRSVTCRHEGTETVARDILVFYTQLLASTLEHTVRAIAALDQPGAEPGVAPAAVTQRPTTRPLHIRRQDTRPADDSKGTS